MTTALVEKRKFTPAPVKPMNPILKKVIRGFEARIRRAPTNVDGKDFPVKHSFAEGVYIREIFMAKNMVIVGHLHRDSYYNIMVSGDISCLTENGIKRMTGANQSIAPPLTKRFGYTHEDTVWQTVHPNPDNITDIDALEKMIIIEEPLPIENKQCNKLLNLFLMNIFFPEGHGSIPYKRRTVCQQQ